MYARAKIKLSGIATKVTAIVNVAMPIGNRRNR
jgi:hypothetical protein